MDLIKLIKKRNFEIRQSFNKDYFLQFHSSDINQARGARLVFLSIGASGVRGDVCGGKAVGGYYTSGFITKNQAMKLKLELP